MVLRLHWANIQRLIPTGFARFAQTKHILARCSPMVRSRNIASVYLPSCLPLE